jgi:hypothetical protein
MTQQKQYLNFVSIGEPEPVSEIKGGHVLCVDDDAPGFHLRHELLEQLG